VRRHGGPGLDPAERISVLLSYQLPRRLAAGGRLGPETSVDKVLPATAEQQFFDTARDVLPGVLKLAETPWRNEYLYSPATTIYGGTAEIQRNIIARRQLDLGRE
jgi:alkylation response protein AidB-like acyl-CoA dehydrogenase